MNSFNQPLSLLVANTPGIEELIYPEKYILKDQLVTGISIDSRDTRAGNIFIALSGIKFDGHDYIPAAIQRGAIAIVGTHSVREIAVPYIKVKDSRVATAYLSAAFFNYPARKLSMIGVTGTDGKTTTANFIFHILKYTGFSVGLISTVSAIIGDDICDTGFHVTTPEATQIQEYLARMVSYQRSPITHAIVESTSHGLAQHRVSACDFDIGVVTNVTHEHLDFHQTYDEYLGAKARLFTGLELTALKEQGNPRLAILNKDDISYPYLVDIIRQSAPLVRIMTYGHQPDVDFRASSVTLRTNGLSYDIEHKNKTYPVEIQLSGEYNVDNSLAAWAVTVGGLGIQPDIAGEGLRGLSYIPGRMEPIQMGQPFQVIVDFAHTPNALTKSLLSVRKLCKGKLIIIFGSAGLRDQEKRRMMAKVATLYADFSIFTAEDPRTEDLTTIIEEMVQGALSENGVEGQTFIRILDRRDAIRTGVTLAKEQDYVLVFGKGHEQSMCFGTKEYLWDDRVAVRAALAELLQIDGPQMPFLPG